MGKWKTEKKKNHYKGPLTVRKIVHSSLVHIFRDTHFSSTIRNFYISIFHATPGDVLRRQRLDYFSDRVDLGRIDQCTRPSKPEPIEPY